MGNRKQEMTSRILVEDANGRWHLCTIVFNCRDGSLYLIPFSGREQYFYGKWHIPAGVMRQDFNYQNQVSSSVPPKVSVHATGLVKIEESTGAKTVGPLYIPKLVTLRDAIIMTISVTDIERLRTSKRCDDTDLVIHSQVRKVTALVCLSEGQGSASPLPSHPTRDDCFTVYQVQDVHRNRVDSSRSPHRN